MSNYAKILPSYDSFSQVSFRLTLCSLGFAWLTIKIGKRDAWKVLTFSHQVATLKSGSNPVMADSLWGPHCRLSNGCDLPEKGRNPGASPLVQITNAPTASSRVYLGSRMLINIDTQRVNTKLSFEHRTLSHNSKLSSIAIRAYVLRGALWWSGGLMMFQRSEF